MNEHQRVWPAGEIFMKASSNGRKVEDQELAAQKPAQMKSWQEIEKNGFVSFRMQASLKKLISDFIIQRFTRIYVSNVVM